MPDDARGSGKANRTRNRGVRFSEGRACDARGARWPGPRSAWAHRPPCVFPHRPRGDRQQGRNGGSVCAWCSRSSRVLPPSSAHSSNCRSPTRQRSAELFPLKLFARRTTNGVNDARCRVGYEDGLTRCASPRSGGDAFRQHGGAFSLMQRSCINRGARVLWFASSPPLRTLDRATARSRVRGNDRAGSAPPAAPGRTRSHAPHRAPP